MISSIFVLASCCVFFSHAVSRGPSCITADGSSVEYFAGLKKNDGSQFALLQGNSFSGAEDLTDASSSVGRTLIKGLYSNTSEIGFLLFNDEPPPHTKSDAYGHTKGVLVWGTSHAFYLVHSVPRWPATQNDPSGYQYPEDEQKYGQSFLCLSLSTATLDKMARLMVLNRPHVYDYYQPASLAAKMPNVAQLALMIKPEQSVATQQKLTLAAGTSFVQFAKTGVWGGDIYEMLVEPYFGADMQFETWQDGGTEMGPYCAGKLGCKYDSFPVQTVTLPDGSSWRTTQDHSKWGVSTATASQAVACIGDINREFPQRKRGGGTFCFTDASMQQAFLAISSSVNSTCTACLQV